MKKLACACSLLLFLAWQPQTASATPPDGKQVAALIAALGSDSFAERERAARELETAGPAALDALKIAARHSDAEIGGRASRLVASIEERILTEKMLAGKKIRLAVKDVSVLDAIRQFNNLSGYPCEIVGNTGNLAERRITLDTGDVTYWEALDQLCRQGRLTENMTTAANMPIRQPGKVYYNNPVPPAPRTTTLLTDGEARQLPVCLQGAVRIAALPAERVAAGEMQILLDVAAENRLQSFGVVGTPFLTKIVDDQAQMLTMVAPEAAPDASMPNNVIVNGNGNVIMLVNVNGRLVTTTPAVVQPQRSVAVRIKLGDKGAKSLKEVSGKLTVQALTPPELLVKAEGILNAAGRSFMGKDGNAIHVQSVDKQQDGSYRIRLSVENPDLQDPFAGRNIRGGRGNFNVGNNNIPYAFASNMPRMVDASGKEHAPEIQQQFTEYNANNQFVLSAVLVYRPTAQPARLVLHGQRTIMFNVPFTLKNVPIS